MSLYIINYMHKSPFNEIMKILSSYDLFITVFKKKNTQYINVRNTSYPPKTNLLKRINICLLYFVSVNNKYI